MNRIACCLLLVACGNSSPPASAPAPTPTERPTPTEQPTPTETGEPGGSNKLDLAQLGAPCGERGLCVEPTTCVKYYGIAGPRGPQFSSCEIPCSEKSACPAGASCVTVADGPGAVCRPDVQPDHPGAVINK